jgi:Leucine-rich repeat (LRR) protein
MNTPLKDTDADRRNRQNRTGNRRMISRTTDMKKSAVSRLAAISLSLSLTALTTGCAVADNAPVAQTPKTVPQMPFTEQSLKAFANAGDYELLFQLSQLQGQENSSDILRRNSVVERYEPFIQQFHLVSYPVTGVYTKNNYRPDEELEFQPLPYLDYGWNKQGRLISLDQSGLTKKDWKIISKLSQLRSIITMSYSGGTDDVDLAWLKPLQQLESIYIQGRRLFHFSDLCQLHKLTEFRAPNIYPQEPVRFKDCQAPLVSLRMQGSRLDDLAVEGLPNLLYLDISKSAIQKISIDGDSLPKLQYLQIQHAKLPEDLSQVKLPESLIQIDMYGSNDPDIKKLILPENLKFLDLGGVKLDDFSFITTAKNLESLYLTDSNFHQYELLLKLPNLKHLILVDHQLTDQQLLILSKLKNLQYLNIAGNPVTSAQPLADLKDLHFIMLGGTNITDYEKIPYWPGVIGIELPNFEEHRRNTKIDDLPEHLQKMVLAGRMEDTEFLNSIPEPPPEIFG